MIIVRTLALLLLAFSTSSPLPAKEGGGCDAYAAQMSRELALLKTPAKHVGANWNIKQSALPLEADQHYLVALHPQNTVGFVVPPAREPREPEPQGGIAYFHVEQPGRYGVAIDTAHWIDVVDSGANVLDPAQAHVLPSVAHRDLTGCEMLRKIVEFELEGGKTYRLHFSGRSAKQVDVVILSEGGK